MSDAVTISLLPVPLALIHIPRTRLQSLSHPVLRHILHPSPTFFTVTANEIEISLFVDYEHVKDFDVIARKDRRSMRKDPVEISYEPWSVLQVDSHTDQHDNSGARVNELSGPLAAAGISILYQSSYMCDFIFVKESRLHEALTLFETAGFDLYTSNMTSSPVPSAQLPSPYGGEYTSTSSSPTVLTLPQSSALSTHSATPVSYTITPNGQTYATRTENTKLHLPTAGEVRILDPELACVGLSDELGVDHWGMKIVKLVAFPELIPSSLLGRRDSGGSSGSSSLFSTSLSCSGYGDDDDYEGDDDGYFSHSPHSISTSELGATSESSSHSVPTDSRSRNPSGGSLPPIITNLTLETHDSEPASPSTSPSIHGGQSPERTTQRRRSSSPTLSVPFFSFTRTQEGSSLTADVKTLAALFPPEERHLLVCCGSLELGTHSDEGCVFMNDEDDLVDDGSGGDDDGDLSIGELKCLQIDLRRFGLDKYGLVNKFSRVLGDNNVNHMYSSTFKTANLLVNKKHAHRAQALLRGC